MMNENIVVIAEITGITYKPFLCNKLTIYNEADLETALNTEASFLLKTNDNTIAVSTWVSPKRTRSYPYARVYNTLGYSGKKITIIPFVKDEGIDGDRDFLQWDTISLMSLLDINVIIGYYSQAVKNSNYENKITNQQFDTTFINNEIQLLLSYQSSALHWNIAQINKIAAVAQLSKANYEKIHKKTGVRLHSVDGINKRIAKITASKDDFMHMSRHNAQSAQFRETQTIQPKEYLTNGIKAKINITNYLGGTYYFVSDEALIDGNKVYLIEGKHTKTGNMPSIDDIKDGLLKMILYSNLKKVKINNKEYTPVPVLKLTSVDIFCHEPLPNYIHDNKKLKIIENLIKESKINNFELHLPWEMVRNV